MTTPLVQIVAMVLSRAGPDHGRVPPHHRPAALARREDTKVAPRVRLLGLSYILVFGAAMIQIISQPQGVEAEALGGLMVLGGVIVIVVVLLEARASRLAGHEDRLDSRLKS